MNDPSLIPPEPHGEEPFAMAADDAALAAEPALAAAEAAPGRSYESAAGRLEEIIRRLDSGEAGLRETLDLCREGRELVEFCAAELEAVGAGLDELRLDELVARLEAGRGAVSGG